MTRWRDRDESGFVDSRRPDPVYHHGLRSGYTGEDEWGGVRYPFVTNSLGFRDRTPRTVSPSPGGRRIVLIGDSFTEGVGMTFEESFAGRIAGALAPGGTEVLNGGVVSYSPKLHELRIRELLDTEGIAFDELYVFLDPSDLQDEVAYESFQPGRLGTADDLFLRESFAWREAVAREGRSMADWSVTGRFVKYRLLGRKRPREAVKDYLRSLEEEFWPWGEYLQNRTEWIAYDEAWRQWGERGLELCGLHVKRLAELCRERGIEMALVIYPHRDMGSKEQLDSPYRRYWREFAAAEGLDLLDLFPPLIEAMGDGERNLFIEGDVHWNAEGHELVAALWMDRFGGRR